MECWRTVYKSLCLRFRSRATLVRGHTVGQLVEALHYTPKGRGFDSRCCHWDFSLTSSFRSHYGLEVNSAFNRNEYQEYFLGLKGGRCVGLTTLPFICADCLEIWEPQPHVTFWACKRRVGGLLYLLLYLWYSASYVCVLISCMFIELEKQAVFWR